MYTILLILWNVFFVPPAGFSEWAAERIVESANGQAPIRLVWNQSVAPSDIESAALAKGVVLTTSMMAARIEITTEETVTGDIVMTLRSMDASGQLLSSNRHTYPSSKSGFRKAFDRFASPALVTVATGLTIYLLYNVRSR
jgi:hypothetical protein